MQKATAAIGFFLNCSKLTGTGEGVFLGAVISYKYNNYPTYGNGGYTTSNSLGVPRTTSNDSSKTIYQNCGEFNSAN